MKTAPSSSQGSANDERHCWHELRESMERQMTSLVFRRAFEASRRRYRPLLAFTEAEAVVAFLTCASSDIKARNDVLIALVEMTREIDERELAKAMLWLGLWPALDVTYARLRRAFRGRERRLVSAICFAFIEALGALDLRRVEKVAGTLVWNTRRRLVDDLKKEAEYEKETDQLDGDVSFGEAVAKPESPNASRVSSQAMAWLARLEESVAANRLFTDVMQSVAELDARDAELLIQVLVEGKSQRTVADELNQPYEGVRKRFQRSCQRLAQHLADKGVPPDFGRCERSDG
jgi:RNA polymerase sigma-70 factor (ECF subfamily)